MIKESNTQEEAVYGFSFGGKLHHTLLPPSAQCAQIPPDLSLGFFTLCVLWCMDVCVCVFVPVCVGISVVPTSYPTKAVGFSVELC